MKYQPVFRQYKEDLWRVSGEGSLITTLWWSTFFFFNFRFSLKLLSPEEKRKKRIYFFFSRLPHTAAADVSFHRLRASIKMKGHGDNKRQYSEQICHLMCRRKGKRRVSGCTSVTDWTQLLYRIRNNTGVGDKRVEHWGCLYTELIWRHVGSSVRNAIKAKKLVIQ